MTEVASLVVGYLIGSIPTAQWLGSLWGVDLRREGSGNPGANNARRVGGMGLAGLVLIVEMTKGAGAALTGLAMAGDLGAVVAGLGAVAGNVYNPWYRLKGGKGLGITAGIIMALWPAALVLCVLVIVVAVAATRSSGLSALITIAALNVLGVAWWLLDLANAWGIGENGLLLVFAVGVAGLIWYRHWADWDVKRRALPTLPG
ncbi:MAG: glycerol-3-phosphate acyltransferase [Acidimicrobiia bacterium]|nr:glycerol-3-phosphate acyltransferase [Acidimicrobiia bacterium]